MRRRTGLGPGMALGGFEGGGGAGRRVFVWPSGNRPKGRVLVGVLCLVVACSSVDGEGGTSQPTVTEPSTVSTIWSATTSTTFDPGLLVGVSRCAGEFGGDGFPSHLLEGLPEDEARLLVGADEGNAVGLAGVDFASDVTAVSWFAGVCRNDLLQVVLDAGGDPDGGCPTALSNAATVNNSEGVEILLDAGADVNLAGCSLDQRWTALHHAAYAGHVEVVERLLEAGADPSAMADMAETPLSWAMIRGWVDIAVMLAEAGGEISEYDYPGALADCDVEMIRAVVEVGGFDPGFVDDQGQLAWEIAEEVGNDEVAEYLKSLVLE